MKRGPVDPRPSRFRAPGPSAHAQTGAARGVVLDEQGEPSPTPPWGWSPGASIARQYETKTNKKGEFSRVGLRAGPYRVTASKEGFAPVASEVQVPLGETIRIDALPTRPGGEGGRERGRGAPEAVRRGGAAPGRRGARGGRGHLQGSPREGPGRPGGPREPRVRLRREEGLGQRRGQLPEGARAAARRRGRRGRAGYRLPRDRPARGGGGARGEDGEREPG